MELKSAVLKSNLIHQFKALPILLIGYIPWLCIFWIIRFQTRIPIGELTRDPLATMGKQFYFGIVSQIGILFWCSCAAIFFFSVGILINIKQNKVSSYLVYSGAITTILLFDDLFLLHEVVFPIYLKISEKIVYLVYLSILSFYVLKFKRTILSTDYLTLMLAFVFFGFSVFMDKGLIPIPQAWLENEGDYLLEDGAKLLGIISWFIYFTTVCLTQIKQAIWHQQAGIR